MYRSIMLEMAEDPTLLTKADERDLADYIREQCADQILKDREHWSVWTVEGNLDKYVSKIRTGALYGGEIEMCTPAKILKQPIKVYIDMPNKQKGIHILRSYGDEYSHFRPIRVWYDGRNHYNQVILLSPRGTKQYTKPIWHRPFDAKFRVLGPSRGLKGLRV